MNQHDLRRILGVVEGLRRKYRATGRDGYLESVVEIVMEGNTVIEIGHRCGLTSHHLGILVVEDWGAERATTVPTTVIIPEKICAVRGHEKFFPYEKENEMKYIDKVAADIGKNCGMTFAEPQERRLLRIYAVLCLAKGARTTSKDVHDAWSAWRVETDPDHRSLVPFKELSAEIQAYDDMYRDAIRKVAVDRRIGE